MKIKLLLVLTWCIITPLFAQEGYNITCGGQGKDGTYLVKVTTKVKETKFAEDELKKCAVHGVLFHGVVGNGDGCNDQKPLIKNPEIEKTKADFFGSFFSNGICNKYVSIVEPSMTSVKESRKSYEVSALLLVDKESLIHYLEEAGIVKGFSNLW